MFEKFVAYLEKNIAIDGFLPGVTAQKIMAPFKEGISDREFLPPPSAKQSSVLVLMQPEVTTFSLLYTVRSSKLRNHTNQISFPGGRAEKEETAIQTALREAEEEIGLLSSNVAIIGTLSPLFVPNSNSGITPVLAVLENQQDYHLNSEEVDEVFTTNINLLQDSTVHYFPMSYNNEEYTVPYWNVHSKIPLWGATAIITKEVATLWSQYTNSNQNTFAHYK